MSSKTVSSTKGSDDKAIVSFSSDTDDDDTSSSSRLSSSESSEEESEVETVTFAVPLPTSRKGVADKKEDIKVPIYSKTSEAVKSVELKKSADQALKESGEKATGKSQYRNDEHASVRERFSLKEVEDKETRKSGGNLEEKSDELRVMKTQTVGNERPKSPKIVINDVEETAEKKDVKGYDGTVTRKTAKKERASSPKKVSNNEEVLVKTSEESAAGKRVTSQRTRDLEVELNESKKPSGKPTASGERETKQEVAATARASRVSEDIDGERKKSSTKKTSGDKEIHRAKSPKITSDEFEPEKPKSKKKVVDDKEIERVKSPKILSEDIDDESSKSSKKTLEGKEILRSKSSKIILDGNDVEGDKSPKKTSEEMEKSPKSTSKEAGEGKKKSSKTPYELLRSAESPEKSPARTSKSKKSSIVEESGRATQNADDLEISVIEKPKTKTSKKTSSSVLNELKDKNTETESINAEGKKMSRHEDDSSHKTSTKIEDRPILKEPSSHKEKKEPSPIRDKIVTDSVDTAVKIDNLELSSDTPKKKKVPTATLR